jgi:general secretion pathway protein E
MWSEEGEKKLVIAVRLTDQSGFIREIGSIRYTLQEQLHFSFNGQRPEQISKLLVLTAEDYDQIAHSELLSSRAARHTFMHQYNALAMGAEIRDSIIAQAVERRASDIHIEPIPGDGEAVSYRVRYRIDGKLQDAGHPLTGDRGFSLVTAIKTKAEMDIADRLRPAGGQISFDSQDLSKHPFLKGYNCRVSTVPTTIGESAVVRILKTPRIESLKLEMLGLPTSVLQQSKELLMCPNGIILMTGPTGSGKTTTLYAMLQTLNDGTNKIFTIEDPVEMTLAGMVQTQVAAEVGRDFKTLLKTALRQDPDVILIGEIRDRETAETAIQAANTGHLVFATLHTNNAIATVARLKELGLDSSRIADNLRGVYAQRLVRQCCPNCVEKYDATDELNKVLDLPPEHKIIDPIELVRPKEKPDLNCGDCSGSGYFQRQIATELWRITSAERDIINSGKSSERELLATAVKEQRFVPLALRGLELVLQRRTSLSEVLSNVVPIDSLREIKLLAKSLVTKRVVVK